jgi:protein-serine/threonine kinase
LLSIQTRSARQRALTIELQGLNKPEKNALRKEYMIRESIVAKEKKKRMCLDDFQVIKVIGHGGFGIVRLVKENGSGEIFAIKSLAKHSTIERNQEDYVKAERRILSIASEIGDWIVRLFYSFQDENFLHFVLEYMPGGDLLGLLIKKDIFDESFAKFYFAEIVLAIEEVHKLGMIHRDIKVYSTYVARQLFIRLPRPFKIG